MGMQWSDQAISGHPARATNCLGTDFRTRIIKVLGTPVPADHPESRAHTFVARIF